jgi:hypothetical protein
VRSDRALGLLAVLAGSVLAFAVQVVTPVGVPLYDGVVVQEPYRYLHPSGAQPGSPGSFAAALPVVGGTSPQVTAFTTESPAQVQLIAQPGAFVLTTGATSLDVAITAIDPPPGPAGGQVSGNVYRVSVTDQVGTQLAIKSCEGCIALVLRAPEDTGAARIQRYANGAWVDVETIHAGVLGLYSTNPTELGDFAIVTGGNGVGPGVDPGVEPGLPMGQILVAAGALAILVVLFAAALVVRRRQGRPLAPSHGRAIPSKRKRPNKPPPGRPDR